MKKCLSLVLTVLLLLSCIPVATAAPLSDGWNFDLSSFLDNAESRRFVEMMLDYHLRHDPAVQKALEEGYSAVFFFEGCSDNMDDETLSDISYYRVSAVCVTLRLDEKGEPYIVYFNENCSTLPDRPLEYGAWYFAEHGIVGPATICDGTYDLYSVKHAGAYEALHMRTSAEDLSIPAIYMNPEGFIQERATEINIHTRNVNHTIQGAMWSAGCVLVGDGDFGQFTELMESTYYSVYDYFALDIPVGTVTINRQCLKEELYQLYENQDAVDMLLAQSRQFLPQNYLNRCTVTQTYEGGKPMQTAAETEVMTLPCSNKTDARSKIITVLPDEEPIYLLEAIQNPLGNLWYRVEVNGEMGYLYCNFAEEIQPPTWIEELWDKFFG